MGKITPCPNCADSPPQSETWKALSQGGVFTPTPSDLIKGSLKTYLEMKTSAVGPDHAKYCPSVASGSVECLHCSHSKESELSGGFYALSASKAIFRARTYNCNSFSPVMMIT